MSRRGTAEEQIYNDPFDEYSETGNQDDDGIANFLSDAIGKDADAEVLRDIGGDNFAELMEVFTSALLPNSCPNSRRNSLQEPEIIQAVSESVPIIIKDENETEDESDEIPIIRKRRRLKIEDDDDESETQEIQDKPIEESSTKIKNRLKIRLKVGTKKSSPVLKSNVTSESQNSPRKVQTTKQESCVKNSNLPLNSSKREANIILHKKCTKRHGAIVKKLRLNISPCCIVLYDILKTDRFIKLVTLPKKTKASSSSINLCKISERKIDDFHKAEHKIRHSYSEILKSFNHQKLPSHRDNKSCKYPVKEDCLPKKQSASLEQPTTSKQALFNLKNAKDHSDTKKKSTPEFDKKTNLRIKSEKSVADNTHKDHSKNSEKKKPHLDEKKDSISPKKHEKSNINSSFPKTEKHKNEPKKETPQSPKKVKICREEKECRTSSPKPLKTQNPSLKKNYTKPPEDILPKQLLDVKSKDVEDTNETTKLSMNNLDKNETGVLEINSNSKSKVTEESQTKFDLDQKLDVEENRVAKTQREKYETKREKDKLFERFENERSRKYLETPKPYKYDSMGKLKLDESLPPLSKLLSQNFRIPKAQGEFQKESKTLTNLGKQESLSPEKLHCPTEKVKAISPTKNNPKDADMGPNSKKNKESQGPCLDLKPQLTPADVKVCVEESHTTVEPVEEDEDYSSPSDNGKTIPPLSEVQKGEFTVAVSELLMTKADIDLPTFECFSNISDATTEKCAWWFAMSDKEPPDPDDSRLPALTSGPSSIDSDNGSDNSFFENLNNLDCQVHEISSTSQRLEGAPEPVRDPDMVDEFCGRSLLQAKIRTSTGQNFRDLFHLRAGALYEKENFQAKCNLCNQLIIGKRDLAKHVRGVTHKHNLRKIDPEMEQSTITPDSSANKPTIEEKKDKLKKPKKEKIEKEESSPKPKNTSTSNGKSQLTTTSNGLSVRIPAKCEPKRRRLSKSPDSRRSDSHSKRRNSRSRSRERERERVRDRRDRRTRSKSRSPLRIPRSPTDLFIRKWGRARSPEHSRHQSRKSRSRSPRRRSRRSMSSEEHRHRKRSPGHHSKRGRRSKSNSPPLPKKDNKEFHEKLCLTAEGKWSNEMEKAWKLMEAEEAMFREQFIDQRKAYVASPEEHPKYANEWTEFWERRYQEVEKEGKDPDTYNYVIEWKDYWAKRLNQLLQEEADDKIRAIKVKYQMDYDSLSNSRKGTVPPNQGEQVAFQLINNPVVMVHSISSRPSIVDVSSISSVNVLGQVVPGPSKIEERKSSVSVEEFKSTWDALTRQKVDSNDNTFVPEFTVTTPFSQQRNPTKSDTTSTSDGSFDFMGFDLVQVLRLMCKTEDQLSFLAPKVLDYYKMAEELELKKSKGSHMLLNNEELVTILFQARDRFMSMIRSNILHREILSKLNLTVYALNAILDAPQCQKFRPKVPSILTDFDESAGVSSIPKDPVVKSDPPLLTPLESKQNTAASNELSLLLGPISSRQKTTIISEITKYLLLVGGEGMSNSELAQFMIKLLTPIGIKKPIKDETNSEASFVDKTKMDLNSFDINKEPITTLGHDYTHSHEYRISGVSSSKVVGSALPTLPFRSGTNDESPNIRNEKINTNEKRGTLENFYDNSSRSQEQAQSRGNLDGRRSPFSRRELAMNPSADRSRY